MIFKQITHDDLGCASYLIGDEDAGVAAVVDPQFDIDPYLELARYRGVRIEHILETHNHADHVSGHGRLVAATGATIHVHSLNDPDYEHEAFDDGWELALGSTIIRALHTPGHRPEHTAFAVIDTRRGAEPWAVLTGDSLFVGDTARSDLAIEKTEGARQIFRSLHAKLLSLPDDCEVWPSHLGGSMCGGAGLDMKICSTIGFEKRHNEALALTDEDEFVAYTLARLGPQPPNFVKIVGLNHGQLLTTPSEPPALYPHQVLARQAAGAQLIDVRTDLQFDEAHIEGSLCVPSFSAGFGTKLAWLVDMDREIVFIGRDDADGHRAARLAAAVGVQSVGGILAGGMTNWRQERQPVAQRERITVERLAELADADEELQIIDVRELAEYQAGHIPGSISVPWHDIDAIPEGVDPAKPIATICAGGVRAGTAASLLALHGPDRVYHVVDGGVTRWPAIGKQLVAA
jgi:glyoxylase-like metal-dependent hydrolase (beta-lactamase superfamily II)/rhodanese-related sulfurtransferase